LLSIRYKALIAQKRELVPCCDIAQGCSPHGNWLDFFICKCQE